jgi:single-strand DNA-binding protein
VINAVVIGGNLTRDPEIRPVGDTTVCDLGVAVNERVKKDGEWEDRPSFFDVTVWGKTAENCAKYLTKGSPVTVQGRIRQERWENDSGDKRSKVKVIAQIVQFGAKNGDGESKGEDGSGLPF